MIDNYPTACFVTLANSFFVQNGADVYLLSHAEAHHRGLESSHALAKQVL